MTGQEFKIQRILLGLTQAELAAKLEVSTNTISRHETKETEDVPKVFALALEKLRDDKEKEKENN